jgi:branched-chain amino acid transport system permease protein
MNLQTLRQSARSGVTFGIVHIFCVLIGFNAMLGILLAKAVGKVTYGTLPDVAFLAAYLCLLGLWAGLNAARSRNAVTFSVRLANGSAAGLSAGLLAAGLALVFHLLLKNQINPREYLSVLSNDFMNACLFNLSPLAGILANLGLFVASGFLGGLLSAVWNIHSVRTWTANNTDKVKTFYRGVRAGSAKHKLVVRIVSYLALFGLIALLPLQWGSYWNYVFGTVGLYVILGLGLNIIVGLSGQLVLGYIAFFAIGAYTMALLNAPVPHHLMWGFWPALLLAVILSALTGLLLGLPIMKLRGDYLAIVTLGFGEIIRILLKSDVLTAFTGGPRGIQDIKGPQLFGYDFTSDVDFMYLIIVAVFVAIFIYSRLQHSRAGRAWLAIREDETVAQATGVNTVQYKLLALMIGAAFAGLAGAIFASRNQFTGPEEHSLMASINVLCLIIVGGMGNIPGTLLGAFALKGLPEILREVENYRMLAFGALLVAMMLSRPEGLIPSRRPTLELPEEPRAPDPGLKLNEGERNDL